MLLNTLEEDPTLDDQYFEWLEENCPCDDHDECDCMGFFDWLEMVTLERQEANCDF